MSLLSVLWWNLSILHGCQPRKKCTVVNFPDVAEMYEIALLARMYLTPIIYPEDAIPEVYRWWLFNLNPIYHLIKLFRLLLYFDLWRSPERIAVAAIVALGTLAIGWIVFTRKADEFAYRI
jgi:ABC-type polysaccharide/polyol phosphate export permease